MKEKIKEKRRAYQNFKYERPNLDDVNDILKKYKVYDNKQKKIDE